SSLNSTDSCHRPYRHILSKTIGGVIVKEGDVTPRSQVFLLFTDGTYYEMYSDTRIEGTKGVDKGGPEQVRSLRFSSLSLRFSLFSLGLSLRSLRFWLRRP